MEPVPHRQHGHLIMRVSECEAFLEYIRQLSNENVQQEMRNFTWLNEEPFRKTIHGTVHLEG